MRVSPRATILEYVMTKKIIHVNRAFIAFNVKYGEPVLPCYIIREGSKLTYGFAVKCNGPFELIDPRTHNQLKCGARAWIETTGDLKITNPMPFQKADALRKKYKAKLEAR